MKSRVAADEAPRSGAGRSLHLGRYTSGVVKRSPVGTVEREEHRIGRMRLHAAILLGGNGLAPATLRLLLRRPAGEGERRRRRVAERVGEADRDAVAGVVREEGRAQIFQARERGAVDGRDDVALR